MKESDYLKATNRVKVSAALTILRDVLDGYGVTKEELSEIRLRLYELESKLFASYELETDIEP